MNLTAASTVPASAAARGFTRTPRTAPQAWRPSSSPTGRACTPPAARYQPSSTSGSTPRRPRAGVSSGREPQPPTPAAAARRCAGDAVRDGVRARTAGKTGTRARPRIARFDDPSRAGVEKLNGVGDDVVALPPLPALGFPVLDVGDSAGDRDATASWRCRSRVSASAFLDVAEEGRLVELRAAHELEPAAVIAGPRSFGLRLVRRPMSWTVVNAFPLWRIAEAEPLGLRVAFRRSALQAAPPRARAARSPAIRSVCGGAGGVSVACAAGRASGRVPRRRARRSSLRR